MTDNEHQTHLMDRRGGSQSNIIALPDLLSCLPILTSSMTLFVTLQFQSNQIYAVQNTDLVENNLILCIFF